MNLRTRLLLVLVGVFVPAAALAALWHEHTTEQRFDASLSAYARARMESGGRQQAEEAPFAFQEPPVRGPRRGQRPGELPGDRLGPPEGMFERMLREEFERPFADEAIVRDTLARERPQLWAYTSALQSMNPNAPLLPAHVRAKAAANHASVAWYERAATPVDDGTWRCLLLPMEWDTGPATWVMIRRVRSRPLGPFGSVESLWLAGMVAAVLVGAAWLAAGPLVRRVRTLESAVLAAVDTSGPNSGVTQTPAGDELDRLARTFDAVLAAWRAQTHATAEREQALRSFVENTAHDTGLPLTVLHSQLAQLRDDAAAGRVVDPQRLRAALEELQYLSSLLRNLSAVAALEAGEGQRVRSEVDLSAMIERVALRHRVIAEQKSITLEYATPEQPVRVLADPTLVEQALNNLVHNAVRYGHDRGHVGLVLHAQAHDFEVRVLDDGVGVQPSELQHLAQRSWRADAARSRVPDGKGIGLAIVRDIAAQHQWSLRFEAVEPHGLCAILSGARGMPATATSTPAC